LLWFPFKFKLVGIDLEFIFLLPHDIGIHHLLLINFELKSKGRSNIQLGLKAHGAIELFNNLLRNDETKANAFGVHLFRILNETKQLE
jgi:hypothetical protein